MQDGSNVAHRAVKGDCVASVGAIFSIFDDYEDGEDSILMMMMIMMMMMVLVTEVIFVEVSSKKAPWQAPLPQDRFKRQRGNASSNHGRCHRSSLICSFRLFLSRSTASLGRC